MSRTVGVPVMLVAISVGAVGRAYGPNDPKVRGMVERGVSYIEKSARSIEIHREASNIGGRALMAYAVYKHRKDKSHPLVQQVIKEAGEILAQKTPSLGQKADYVCGVVITFLTELDDPRLNPLIAGFYQMLLKSQRSDGSWSYTQRGDTSVTQYGMLATWAVRHADIPGATVPDSSIEKATNWLLRTQSTGGDFGYTPNDPGGYSRVPQNRTTLSMLAAGGGSLYMAADLLNFRRDAQRASNAGPEFLSPDAEPASKPGRPTTTAFPHQLLWDSLQLADGAWQRRFNILNDGPSRGDFQCYYLYTMERYMSFRDKVLGLKEPAGGARWYNMGVDYLAKSQTREGAWNASASPGELVSTSFAILFLVRSTQDKIKIATAAGHARGGIGVPDNFQTAIMKDGEVVAPKKTDVVKDFAAILDSIDEGDIPDNVELPPGDGWKKDKSTLEKLKEQVRNNPDYRARLLAIRPFVVRGDIESAPILIYALTDPAWQVSVEARNGLRRISRKIGGFGLSSNPSEGEKLEAQRRWSQWYLSVRPDGEL